MTDNRRQRTEKRKHARVLRAICLLSSVFCLLSCTAFGPPQANFPDREGIIPGETVTVQGNQNIYVVAQQYHVPMRDLIVLNNIKPPFTLRAGDKLTLPAGHRGAGASEMATASSMQMPPPGPASVTAVEATSLPPVQSAPLPPPSAGAKYANTPKPSTPSAEVLTTPSPVKPMQSTAAPPGGQPLASLTPPEITPPPEAPDISFKWPVQGPVLSPFGPKGQGLNNDGVNIGAPKGAPVVAAASGIVVYAGNEMKGFGNLILIRHQGGWVTAYAHLDRTLVSKDAVVAAGDEIGTVGKSGSVSSPQLHFETRYQGKPVDPAGVVKNSG